MYTQETKYKSKHDTDLEIGYFLNALSFNQAQITLALLEIDKGVSLSKAMLAGLGSSSGVDNVKPDLH